MTEKEKSLLLQDLCARLPYGVKVYALFDKEKPLTREMGLGTLHDFMFDNIEVKPYLRPMSSMTEEEKNELERLIDKKLNKHIDQEDNEWTPWVLYDTTGIKNDVGGERFYFDEMSFIYDWLNAHYFDFRNLIERGLAIEAPKDMYKI